MSTRGRLAELTCSERYPLKKCAWALDLEPPARHMSRHAPHVGCGERRTCTSLTGDGLGCNSKGATRLQRAECDARRGRLQGSRKCRKITCNPAPGRKFPW
jgi:hypothetical protein